MTHLDVGLIGYGEVGKIFSGALKAKGLKWVGAWDSKFIDTDVGESYRRHAVAHHVVACDSVQQLCEKIEPCDVGGDRVQYACCGTGGRTQYSTRLRVS